MKIDLDNASDDAQIQILPLIDVIFCILTFFILAVVQLQRPQGVNVDIPKAETGTVQPPERLIVTLSPGGQVFVGQREVDRTTLADETQKYLQQKPDGVVVLNASQNAFYSDVIGILDLMRKVGGNRVALATNPAQPTPSPSPNPFSPNPGLNNPGLNNPSGIGNPSSPGGFPSTPNPLLPNQPSGSGLFPSGSSIDPLNPSITPTPLVPGGSAPGMPLNPSDLNNPGAGSTQPQPGVGVPSGTPAR